MSDRESRGGWFGPDDRPLAGWWSLPDAPTPHGVVIAGPIGYEWWSTHRTLRTLAERLADRGHAVLRFDYDGLGDSSGERWDPGRVDAWRASLGHAVAEMRARGFHHVSLVGFRFGGLLALLGGAGLGVDSIAAWVPVESGRTFARSLKMLGLPVPGVEGAIVNAGLVVSEETAAALGGLDLKALEAAPAPRVLLMARPEQPLDALADRIRPLGPTVDVLTMPGVETALDVPSEEAVVPTAIVDALADWIGDAAPGEPVSASEPTPRSTAEIAGSFGTIRETMTQVAGLTAVRGDPLGATPSTVVVFLNSGSEPHVGPGGAWVDYSRAITAQGHAALRVDFRGWGESPDDGHAPGRPYDRHCLDDAIALTDALRGEFDRVVLAGLCAGAWIGMHAAQETPVDAIVAINPQLYWDFGCPVEATIPQTRARRTRQREREALGGRYGVWSALDLVGIRPMATRWMQALRDRRTPVAMLFAEGDDGLEYLRNRCARALDRELRLGNVQVAELGDLDHQMYREWRRDEVAGRITAFVAGLEATTGALARPA
jgi:dienelactone hydrolase